MTIVERILAAHSGIDIVRPGCFVMVNPDLVFANEQTGEPAIGEFKKLGKPRGFDPAKVALTADHLGQCGRIRAAEAGDELEADLNAGTTAIITEGRLFPGGRYPGFMMDMIVVGA